METRFGPGWYSKMGQKYGMNTKFIPSSTYRPDMERLESLNQRSEVLSSPYTDFDSIAHLDTVKYFRKLDVVDSIKLMMLFTEYVTASRDLDEHFIPAMEAIILTMPSHVDVEFDYAKSKGSLAFQYMYPRSKDEEKDDSLSANFSIKSYLDDLTLELCDINMQADYTSPLPIGSRDRKSTVNAVAEISELRVHSNATFASKWVDLAKEAFPKYDRDPETNKKITLLNNKALRVLHKILASIGLYCLRLMSRSAGNVQEAFVKNMRYNNNEMIPEHDNDLTFVIPASRFWERADARIDSNPAKTKVILQIVVAHHYLTTNQLIASLPPLSSETQSFLNAACLITLNMTGLHTIKIFFDFLEALKVNPDMGIAFLSLLPFKDERVRLEESILLTLVEYRVSDLTRFYNRLPHFMAPLAGENTHNPDHRIRFNKFVGYARIFNPNSFGIAQADKNPGIVSAMAITIKVFSPESGILSTVTLKKHLPRYMKVAEEFARMVFVQLNSLSLNVDVDLTGRSAASVQVIQQMQARYKPRDSIKAANDSFDEILNALRKELSDESPSLNVVTQADLGLQLNPNQQAENKTPQQSIQNFRLIAEQAIEQAKNALTQGNSFGTTRIDELLNSNASLNLHDHARQLHLTSLEPQENTSGKFKDVDVNDMFGDN